MNIEQIGPGLWYQLHKNSLRAVNPEGKLYFKQFIENLHDDLAVGCDCREHFEVELANNPLSDFENIEFGYFSWGWALHNRVNSRLGKSQMDWETAFDIYRNPKTTVCNKDPFTEVKRPVVQSNYRFVSAN